MSKLPWIAAAATGAYLMLSVGVLRLFDRGVPSWLEGLLSLLVAPAFALLTLWNPLLRRLGLSRGEWVIAPSPLAFVVLVVLYAALAFGLTWVVVRWLQR